MRHPLFSDLLVVICQTSADLWEYVLNELSLLIDNTQCTLMDEGAAIAQW